MLIACFDYDKGLFPGCLRKWHSETFHNIKHLILNFIICNQAKKNNYFAIIFTIFLCQPKVFSDKPGFFKNNLPNDNSLE